MTRVTDYFLPFVHNPFVIMPAAKRKVATQDEEFADNECQDELENHKRVRWEEAQDFTDGNSEMEDSACNAKATNTLLSDHYAYRQARFALPHNVTSKCVRFCFFVVLTMSTVVSSDAHTMTLKSALYMRLRICMKIPNMMPLKCVRSNRTIFCVIDECRSVLDQADASIILTSSNSDDNFIDMLREYSRSSLGLDCR